MATARAAPSAPAKAFPGEDAPPGTLSTSSWVTYDLANTLFSMNVVSLYFPLWVVNHAGGNDGMLGVTTGASMLAVAFLAPILGAFTDASGKRMPFLVATTLACVTLTVFLARTPLVTALVLFGFANALYQLGLVAYDALLPDVSTPATRGRIGGIGVGVGYVGSFIGIGAGTLLLARDAAYSTVFLATGALFLLFAIPAFLFVRERERPRVALPMTGILTRVVQTAKESRRFPGLTRFLVGRWLFADAANTLIVFMAVYVNAEVGFTEAQTPGVLAVGIVGAVVGGLFWGFVADRTGPKRALFTVLSLWLVTFTLTIAIPVLDLPGTVFWGVAALAGFSLGGTWATDRPFMLRLTPPTRVGEFYGLYAMAGRFAAVTGPLVWALIVTGLGWGRPAAVGALALMVVASMVILAPVRDTPPAGLSAGG